MRRRATSLHALLIRLAVASFGIYPWVGICSADESASPQVSFTRDIRPLLSDHCFRCHGPDEQAREAELRLDMESEAKRETSGHIAIVPGDLARSELWRRVTSSDDAVRMPPPEVERRLKPGDIDLLKRWIEQGAPWEQHWSFVRPQRPALPAVAQSAWIRNPVDAYVLHKMHEAGLRPNPESDKERLIRRVSLDLTGLPPTPAEVDAFLADPAPQAYEQLVDRLLASPRYGERMAWNWLDGARYADTSGYQNDGPRSMWRWRDWVIDAFNRNLPFDQFTLEQIAGDLLPNASRDQRIATGFNRNHRGNSEGGIIPEEYQVEYVVDRVDTTCTVWLGLTMGCARCHDHKYDPVSQREFYQVYAYFNNIPEFGRAIKEGNSPPFILAPTDEQETKLAAMDAALAKLEQDWASKKPVLERDQQLWEKSPEAAQPRNWFVQRGLVTEFNFDQPLAATTPAVASGSVAAPNATTPRVVNGEQRYTAGRIGQSLELDGQQFVEADDAGNFGYFDKFSVAVWVKPHAVRTGTLVSRMTDEEQADGWYVQFHNGHVQVNLVKRWLDDAIRIETTDTIPIDAWTHIAVTYDGSRTAKGIGVYVNGRRAPVYIRLDLLNQTFASKEPLRIGAGGGPQSRLAGTVDELRIYQRVLERDEVAILATADSIDAIARIPRESRNEGQQLKLTSYFRDVVASESLRSTFNELVASRQERATFAENLPTVMVMDEMPQPRETFVLRRGEYNRPGEKVQPGVPNCLPPLPQGVRPNRLAFARWLVSAENPLTARVAVNRIWQMHFGAGLVRTTEDFGLQGEPPSHPQLLDWLAVEFMESGWDLKHLHRLIVTSATYRQSSRADADQLSKDSENRWLARGPRFRLSAEMIRDQALALSGLLVEQLGGPSVRPYQPADLWKDLATDNVYVQDHGANLYRRSLYTYWKRTVAPPAMTTFDAATREACQVRSSRTNTPLQALTLMNDVTYVEAARLIAERMMKEGGTETAERLRYGFRLCTARQPTATEIELLRRAFAEQLVGFQADLSAASQLLSQGEYPRDARRDPAELAAYTTVASLLLNLDELVTQQ